MVQPTMAAQATHNKQAAPVRLTIEQVLHILYSQASKEALRRHFARKASDAPPRRGWEVRYKEDEEPVVEDGARIYKDSGDGWEPLVLGGVLVWAKEVLEGEVEETCDEEGAPSVRVSEEREVEEEKEQEGKEQEEKMEVAAGTDWVDWVDRLASGADRASTCLETEVEQLRPFASADDRAASISAVQAEEDAGDAGSDDDGESVISVIIGCYLDLPETDGSDDRSALPPTNHHLALLERLLPGVIAAAGYAATEGTEDEGAGSIDSGAHSIPHDLSNFVISNPGDESGSGDASSTGDEAETWVRV